MKWGCWGHWGCWGCWVCWGHWGHSNSKAWKITTEHSRVIQVVEFSFVLMFWKPIFLVKSWNIIFQILHLFCWRLLRPVYVTFLKIGSNNQNVHISEFQNYLQIYSNLYISFSQSQILKKHTFCPRTPCTVSYILEN